MPEDYIFEQDKQFSQFTRTAPISLTAHDLAVRRLSGEITDVNYFGKVAIGSFNSKTVIWRMVIGYNQTLRCIYKWSILPLYGEKEIAIWDKLEAANKLVSEKNMDVIDKLEEIELLMIPLLSDKKLIYEIEQEETGEL